MFIWLSKFFTTRRFLPFATGAADACGRRWPRLLDLGVLGRRAEVAML